MVALGAGGAASLRLDVGDVARIRLTPTLGPLSETLFSLRLVWQRSPIPLVAAWQRSLQGQLGDWAAPLRLFATASPPIDLHTIAGEVPDIEPALDALVSAPVELLHEELEPLAWSASKGPGWAQTWLHDLARGDARAVEALVVRLRRYHRYAVAPYWAAIRTFLGSEQAERGQAMIRAGVDGVLRSLHPKVSWRPPLLGLDAGGAGRTSPSVHALGGRSLLVVPSVFCLDGPYLFRGRGGALPYVLVYPALREIRDATSLWSPTAAPEATALAKLLGTTRASALRAVGELRTTTTELARRLRVSPATASHHLAVLRAACLVTSSRKGTEVGYRVTALGAALLDLEHVPHCPCDSQTPSMQGTSRR